MNPSYQSEEQQRAQNVTVHHHHYPATTGGAQQSQGLGSGFDSHHSQPIMQQGYTSTGNSGLGEHGNLQQPSQGGLREGQQQHSAGHHGHGVGDNLRSRVDAAGAPHSTLAGVGEGYGAGVAGHHDGSFGKHGDKPQYGRSDEQHSHSHGLGIGHGHNTGHGTTHGHNDPGHHTGAAPAAGAAAAAGGMGAAAGAYADHARGHDGFHDDQRHDGHSLQTGGGKLGGPPAPPPAGVVGHGGHDHSGHVREGPATTGQHKPSIGDKIVGSIEVGVGKMTHNVEKVEAGQAKKQGLETGRETHGEAAQFNTPAEGRAGYKVNHPDEHYDAARGQAGFGGQSTTTQH